jgi:hypothetical protein
VTDGTAYTVLQAKDNVYIPPPPEPPIPIPVPKPNLTQEITISIPAGATVKMARLYNYVTWSTPDYGSSAAKSPGMPAEADIWFNGVKKVCKHGEPDNLTARDELDNPIDYGNGVIQYWDTKGQGYKSMYYDVPSGTFAWDVTDLVTGSGTYTAKIQNNDTTPTDWSKPKYSEYKYWERFVTYGFGLLVVYEEKKGPANVEYWIDEGCDLIYNYSYLSAPIATTSAPFDGVVNWGDPAHEPWDRQRGDLTTVDVSADMGNTTDWDMSENMIYFNGLTNADRLGPSTAVSDQAIGVDTFVDVPLIHEGNIAYFQDRDIPSVGKSGKGDYQAVSNAFLVVEKLSKGKGN